MVMRAGVAETVNAVQPHFPTPIACRCRRALFLAREPDRDCLARLGPTPYRDGFAGLQHHVIAKDMRDSQG